jgi:hypothetical protein
MAPNEIVPREEKDLVVSTLTYRKVVGFMGIFLTPVLFIFAGFVFPSSISAYYYQASGTIFGGTLCAIGMFLCCYKGYELGDHVGSFLAGVAAIVVGLCPTAPDPSKIPVPTSIKAHQDFLSNIHWISAGIFFLAITYLCWFQFIQTRKEPGFVPNPQKLSRNFWYRFCGAIMLVGLLGILADKIWPNVLQRFFTLLPPVLFFETIAIVAFGFAWLIKGEGLLKDK